MIFYMDILPLEMACNDPKFLIRILGFNHVSFVQYKLPTTSLLWSKSMLCSTCLWALNMAFNASKMNKFGSVLKNRPIIMCDAQFEKGPPAWNRVKDILLIKASSSITTQVLFLLVIMYIVYVHLIKYYEKNSK